MQKVPVSSSLGNLRLPFLDGLRGATIIGMLLTHAMEFSAFDPRGGGIIYFEPDSPMTMAPAQPLYSMTTIFFCIMGMSLPVSLALRKQKEQSFLMISKHMIFRAALLIFVGLGIGIGAQFALGTGSGLALVFNGKEPISMLGFSELLAFVVIYFFPSWRKLLALSGISYVLVTLALFLPIGPYLGPASQLLLTGSWSILKCLPVILFGAGVVSAVLQNQPISKRLLLAFSIATLALLSFILPMYMDVSGSMYYFMVPEVAYQMSLGYVLFKFIEESGHKLVPVIAVGRTGLYLYTIHMVFMALFLLYIPHTPGLFTGILVSSVSLAILWPAGYLYLRGKVGNIGAQYATYTPNSSRLTTLFNKIMDKIERRA